MDSLSKVLVQSYRLELGIPDSTFLVRLFAGRGGLQGHPADLRSARPPD